MSYNLKGILLPSWKTKHQVKKQKAWRWKGNMSKGQQVCANEKHFAENTVSVVLTNNFTNFKKYKSSCLTFWALNQTPNLVLPFHSRLHCSGCVLFQNKNSSILFNAPDLMEVHVEAISCEKRRGTCEKLRRSDHTAKILSRLELGFYKTAKKLLL